MQLPTLVSKGSNGGDWCRDGTLNPPSAGGTSAPAFSSPRPRPRQALRSLGPPGWSGLAAGADGQGAGLTQKNVPKWHGWRSAGSPVPQHPCPLPVLCTPAAGLHSSGLRPRFLPGVAPSPQQRCNWTPTASERPRHSRVASAAMGRGWWRSSRRMGHALQKAAAAAACRPRGLVSGSGGAKDQRHPAATPCLAALPLPHPWPRPPALEFFYNNTPTML